MKNAAKHINLIFFPETLFLVLYMTAEEQQRMRKIPGNMETHSIKERFKTYGIYVIEKIPREWWKKEFWMESTHENYFSLTSAFSWSASLCSSCWISAFLRWIVEVIFRKEILIYVYKRIRGGKMFMSLSSYSMKTCYQL